MKKMNIQFHKTRPQNPFDDGAKARLHRMGLLRIDGSVDEATLGALSRAYSGLLFDDLCDTCQNSCEITEILRRLSSMPEIPGLMLWKSGHAGVYIGGGYAIEAMGTRKGVVKTEVSGRGWQGWCKLPYIDYLEVE